MKKEESKGCSMVKILVCGLTSNLGGMETYILNLIRNMDHEEFQFDFIVNSDGKLACKEEFISFGGTVYPLHGRRENLILHTIEYRKFFKEHASEYDIIYLQAMSLFNINPLIYAKKYGIPNRLIHSHIDSSFDGKIKNVISKRHLKKLDCYTNKYLACSKSAGEWMFPNKKFDVIKNAIDTKKFAYRKDVRIRVRKKLNVENKVVYGTVGRLSGQKNPLFIVELFAEIHRRNPDTLFIHIGDGELREQMENKIKEFGIEDSYLLLGIQSETQEFYQAMDVFLLPSLFEGLPFVLVEAQCSGLNCFVSDAIKKEAMLVEDIVTYISLQDSVSQWADCIEQKQKNFCRQDRSEEIKNSGYDLEENRKKLEEIFEK